MEHFTSIIPLRQWPESFSFEPFLETVQQMLPGASINHAGRPTELHTRAVTLTVNGVDMLVSMTGDPLDKDLMEQAVSLAHTWPGAAEAVRDCPAHARACPGYPV